MADSVAGRSIVPRASVRAASAIAPETNVRSFALRQITGRENAAAIQDHETS
jgi:hypothetical protein